LVVPLDAGVAKAVPIGASPDRAQASEVAMEGLAGAGQRPGGAGLQIKV